MDDIALKSLAKALLVTVEKAGQVIMDVRAGHIEVRHKQDFSPVTLADEEAEAIILADLARFQPAIPVIAEELAAKGDLPEVENGSFFLVDPLDGTKEFINRGDSFTVNIALIRNQRPVMGVVYAPAKDRAFWGVTGLGAFEVSGLGSGDIDEQPIRVRKNPEKIVIVASSSHLTPETEDFIAAYPGAEIINSASSLKFCLLAAGEADLYPRFGPTMEWDTAAGQAVLEAAGGEVLNPDGSRFSYRKPEFRNGFFIARGDRDIPIL